MALFHSRKMTTVKFWYGGHKVLNFVLFQVGKYCLHCNKIYTPLSCKYIILRHDICSLENNFPALFNFYYFHQIS